MQEEIRNFIRYLKETKNAAENTVVSYERDLRRLCAYLKEQGIESVDRVSSTALNTYMLHLEEIGMSTATVSRMVATMRRFFDFECKHGTCRQDPSELLKAPKVEKKTARELTREELERLLSVEASGAKALRDRAMILAMCRGVRASEVVGLSVMDLNLDLGFLTVRGARQTRAIPMGARLSSAMKKYIREGRDSLLRGRETDMLFVNCSGGTLSRQGVWKVVKLYGDHAGIPELTPDGLRLPKGALMQA